MSDQSSSVYVCRKSLKESPDKDIINALHEAGFADAHWEQLGIQVKVPRPQLDNIRANRSDVEDKLADVITQWRRKDPDASWENLAEALSEMGKYGLATAEAFRQAVGLQPDHQKPQEQDATPQPQHTIPQGMQLTRQALSHSLHEEKHSGPASRSAKNTLEYQRVRTNLESITRALQLNPPASQGLRQKFKQEGWLGLTASPTEEQLVTLALGRIEQDVGQYGEFIAMLRDVDGMDLIVNTLTVSSSQTTTSGDMGHGASSSTSSKLTTRELGPEQCSAYLMAKPRPSTENSGNTELTLTVGPCDVDQEESHKAQEKPPNKDLGKNESEIVATIRAEIDQLEEMFDDLVLHAQKDMITHQVDVERLCQSIVRLPYELKKEHKKFIKEMKDDLKEAESVKDIFFTANEYWDFLNYSLLQHIIGRHASDEVKEEMERYSQEIIAFREKTSFSAFSKAYKRKPKKIDHKFKELISVHDIDWSTATLEDVEQFRGDFCNELSLIDFSLQLAVVKKGSVVLTLLVPQSLVAHIQKTITLSSWSMKKHHVTQLTVDGFITYDSSAAMQGKYKVMRLEWEAIHVNYSYLLDQMAPDDVLPHLVARRLLRPEKMKEVQEKTNRLKKITTILGALQSQLRVGLLPTFCAALASAAGQEQIAKKLTQWYHCLLRGETPLATSSQHSNDIIISGEACAEPSPPPPASHLITAQVEATTLAQAQYNTIAALMCSLLHLPTGALVYDGHTSHPLTLHWHCAAEELGEDVPRYSISLLTAMAREGIVKISVKEEGIRILQKKEVALFESAWDGDVKGVMCALKAGVCADVTRPDGWTALMYAVLNGHEKVVDALLQHGASVDKKNTDGRTAVMLAALNGHEKVINILQQHGISVDKKNTDGWNALMFAAQNGHEKLVETLLQHGVSVDKQNANGWTALMSASSNGHTAVVETLLQHGAKVDMQDKDGCTSLRCASRMGHSEVVEVLLQHCASVDTQDKKGRTPLMSASGSGHTKVVEILLQHKARVNMQKEDGCTALMLAAQNGHKNVVEILLQQRASVNMWNKDGWTALMIAAQNGHKNVVEILMQHGASVDMQKSDGGTALMLAAQNGHERVVETLLQHGASVDLQSVAGATALMIAIYCGSSSVLEVLFRAKPDVNVPTYGKEGQTPLLIAVRKGNVVLARELLEAGANPNHMEEGGLSALMLCCESGSCEMAKLLLKFLADPDLQQSDTGFTALMFASQGGHLDTVLTLLDYNSNAGIKNKAGMTAADVASINLHSDVYSVLQLMAPQETAAAEELEVVEPSSDVQHVIERFHERMDHETMTAIFSNELPDPDVARRRFHDADYSTEGSQPKEHI